MSSAQHQDLANGRWHTMSLAEQLGNVGSEYSRASQWKAKGQAALFQKAFDRLLELIDLTLADNRWRGPKRKEISRVRQQVCTDLLQTANSSSSLMKYFDAMAVAARRS